MKSILFAGVLVLMIATASQAAWVGAGVGAGVGYPPWSVPTQQVVTVPQIPIYQPYQYRACPDGYEMVTRQVETEYRVTPILPQGGGTTNIIVVR